MLDENPEDVEPIVDEIVEVEAPADVVEAEAEEVIIGFDGETVEAEDEPTPLIKQLRAEIKAKAKRARELEAKVAEYEATKAPAPLAEKPTIESCGFDDGAYEKALETWFEGKAQRDAEAKKAADAETARQAEWTAKYTGYEEQKAALKVRDFDEAEDAVRNVLSREQQAIIVRNIEKPASFVYALGKSPAKVAELAAMKDLDKFTAAVVRLEGKVTVTERKAPPPETRLPGSSVGMGAAKNLEAMKAKAQQSGDYTAYFAEKRKIEAAGQKA